MLIEDQERAEIAEEMTLAVRESGLSQNQFARAMGTSPARMSAYTQGKTVPSAVLYRRAVRFAEARRRAMQAGLVDPTSSAERVNRALADEDEEWAFRQTLRCRDDLVFALTRETGAVPAWRHRAARVQDPRFDQLIRALVEHCFEEAGRQVPAWTESLYFDSPWEPEDPFRDSDTVRGETPDWLRRRGIHIAARTLSTA
ncbi:helix-turn-helix transcriptional regulator [Ornithinimicrobium sp. F0845]|uniref:helix-turn-helix domain-containing protein n=1 Tax=Ornithinimicrobium sp. F0845 TaxID=2926412 RepID=UPI001FF3B5E4|nr:helix-turn-helix transcriptional regulator [Ornithinimicrobium sp. F0845]MCK0113621.1 helix-turn-helix transcriptional regulator [Ornithinimicrobium sp. F0845]